MDHLQTHPNMEMINISTGMANRTKGVEMGRAENFEYLLNMILIKTTVKEKSH